MAKREVPLIRRCSIQTVHDAMSGVCVRVKTNPASHIDHTRGEIYVSPWNALLRCVLNPQSAVISLPICHRATYAEFCVRVRACVCLIAVGNNVERLRCLIKVGSATIAAKLKLCLLPSRLVWKDRFLFSLSLSLSLSLLFLVRERLRDSGNGDVDRGKN